MTRDHYALPGQASARQHRRCLLNRPQDVRPALTRAMRHYAGDQDQITTPSVGIMPDHVVDRGAPRLDLGASRSPTYQAEECVRPARRRCIFMQANTRSLH